MNSLVSAIAIGVMALGGALFTSNAHGAAQTQQDTSDTASVSSATGVSSSANASISGTVSLGMDSAPNGYAYYRN